MTDPRVPFLLATPDLNALTAEELTPIAAICDEVDLPAGERLFLQGAAADAWYVVRSGAVDVLRQQSDGGERLVAVIGVHGLVGEFAMLDDVPRTASVLAREPVRLLRCPRDGFVALLEAGDSAARKLVRAMGATVVRRLVALELQLEARDQLERTLH